MMSENEEEGEQCRITSVNHDFIFLRVIISILFNLSCLSSTLGSLSLVGIDIYFLVEEPLEGQRKGVSNRLIITHLVCVISAFLGCCCVIVATLRNNLNCQVVANVVYMLLYLTQITFAMCMGAQLHDWEPNSWTTAILILVSIIAGSHGLLFIMVAVAAICFCILRSCYLPLYYCLQTPHLRQGVCAICKVQGQVRISKSLAFHYACLHKFIHSSSITQQLLFFEAVSRGNGQYLKLTKGKGKAFITSLTQGIMMAPFYIHNGIINFVDIQANAEIVPAPSTQIIKRIIESNHHRMESVYSAKGLCVYQLRNPIQTYLASTEHRRAYLIQGFIPTQFIMSRWLLRVRQEGNHQALDLFDLLDQDAGIQTLLLPSNLSVLLQSERKFPAAVKLTAHSYYALNDLLSFLHIQL